MLRDVFPEYIRYQRDVRRLTGKVEKHPTAVRVNLRGKRVREDVEDSEVLDFKGESFSSPPVHSQRSIELLTWVSTKDGACRLSTSH